MSRWENRGQTPLIAISSSRLIAAAPSDLLHLAEEAPLAMTTFTGPSTHTHFGTSSAA